MERRQLNLALLLQALSTQVRGIRCIQCIASVPHGILRAPRPRQRASDKCDFSSLVQAGAEGLTEDSWLTDEDLVTCVHADGSLCVGYKRTLLCVHDRDGSDAGLVGTEPPRLADGPALTWTYSSADAAQATSSVQAVPEGEAITTATWLHIPSNERPGSPPVFRGAQSPTLAVDVTRKVVLLGTSSGHVQLHDARGHLLHRQLLHEQPVLGVQVAPTPPGAIAAMPGQHAHTVVVSQRGALCSICTCAIGAVLRHVIAHAGAAAVAIPLQRVVFGFTKWLMPRGTCARSDGACVPAAPHLWRDALCAFTRGGVADGAAASFISVGQGPAVTLFEAVDAEGAPAPDPPGLEALGDGGGALDVKSMAKGLAGAVLGPAATAATDLLGIHAPGCRTLAADTVNAIIGAARDARAVARGQLSRSPSARPCSAGPCRRGCSCVMRYLHACVQTTASWRRWCRRRAGSWRPAQTTRGA